MLHPFLSSCRQHGGPELPCCRWVQLRSQLGTAQWHAPTYICCYCRNILHGFFRYVKTEEELTFLHGKSLEASPVPLQPIRR